MEQEIQNQLATEWGDLLTMNGNKVEIVGALKIGEPTKLSNALRAAGCLPKGKATTFSNGEQLSRTWIWSQKALDTIRSERKEYLDSYGINA